MGKSDEAIIMCWLSGNGGSYQCARRKISWLISSEALGVWATVTIALLISTILSFMCLRHCSRNGMRPAIFPGRFRLRLPSRLRGSRRPRANSREDMRERLVAISMVDVSRRADNASPEVTAGSTDERTAPPGNRVVVVDETADNAAACCAICQCEMQVRI